MVVRVVDETNCAGTEEKDVLAVGEMTLMSNIPWPTDRTWTLTDSADASSFCKIIKRSYMSPPKRRDVRWIHGEGRPALRAG